VAIIVSLTVSLYRAAGAPASELLELRFSQPDTMPGQAPPLLVSTVDVR
jgi:hypothetical protein